MTREIKFRAWDKKNKRFIEGGGIKYIFYGEDTIEVYINEPYSDTGENRQNDFIIMQYTGLKDKNGKEIYDGDIVIADCKKGLVNWDISKPSYLVRFGENKFNYLHDVIEIEIIGNIYENPELLNNII